MAILLMGFFSTALFLLFFVRIVALSNAQFDTLAEDALSAKGHATPKVVRERNRSSRDTKALPDRPSSPEKEIAIGLA